MQRKPYAGVILGFLVVLGVIACTTKDTSEGTPEPGVVGLAVCELATVIPPTPPAEIPGYAELDVTTQLHVTGEMPELDFENYRLVITGSVPSPISLTYDEIRCMPKREVRSVLVCPGFFEDEATWAGTPLSLILEQAGLERGGATQLRLRGADGYMALVDLEDAFDPRSILAYEWEGEPLPVLHGFPLRAVFPELQGNKWVKWLVTIEVR